MNISQEQLARELHVSFATVNRWENVKNSPNMLAMKELNDLCKEKGLEEALIDSGVKSGIFSRAGFIF